MMFVSSVMVLITSCNKDDDDSSSSSFTPPNWIIGTWLDKSEQNGHK